MSIHKRTLFFLFRLPVFCMLSLMTLLLVSGCHDDDDNVVRRITMDLLPAAEPGIEPACLEAFPSYFSGTIEVEIQEAALEDVKLFFQIEEEEWIESTAFTVTELEGGGLLFTWDTNAETQFQDTRVQDIYLKATENTRESDSVGPVVIDNTQPPAITAFAVPGEGDVLRGSIPVEATVSFEEGTTFSAELAFSVNGEPFQCATVDGESLPNPAVDFANSELTFSWDSSTDIEQSNSEVVEVTLRLVVLSTTFDPLEGVMELQIQVGNNPPVAVDDETETAEEEALDIMVLDNDSDDEGDELTIDSVTDPDHGTAVNNVTYITYTPEENFAGTDTFVYTVRDAYGAVATGAVTVNVTPVNDPPTANDDAAETKEDTAVDIAVLANDTDPDGDDLSIDSVTDPAHGTTGIVDGVVRYAPADNWSGSDSFQYTMSDGDGETDTADVTVTVLAVNDPPLAVDDEAGTEEEILVSIAVLDNDSDIETGALTVVSVTQPANGTAVIAGDLIDYTPDTDFNGFDSFTYEIEDAGGASATATVSVEVTPVNDPPVAADDAVQTLEDTALVIAVLDNDGDVDGDAVAIDPASLTDPAGGQVELSDGDTTITYTPVLNFNGTDSFSYGIVDGNGGSDTATVTVTVVPVNDPPVAVADEAQTYEETPVAISVLDNDSDIDGDTLAIESVTDPEHGTAVIDGDTVVYSPAAEYDGTDSFSCTITDGNGGNDAATVSVTVMAKSMITLAPDTLSVFSSRTAGEGNSSFFYSSVALPRERFSDLGTIPADAVVLSAFPVYGDLEPSGFAKLGISDTEILFYGNEEGWCDPSPALPRKVAPGMVIPSQPFDFHLYAGGDAEPSTTPPLVVAETILTIDEETFSLILVYVLDPTHEAQEQLNLDEASIELPGAYPEGDFGSIIEPGAPLPAVAGIQVYTPEYGLVGLFTIDPASGDLTKEIVLDTQMPRPGLQGGVHDGTVTVYTIDERSGAPLSGTSVVLTPEGEVSQEKRTDEDGMADFTGLEPGQAYSVSAGGRAVIPFSLTNATARQAVLTLEKVQHAANEIVAGAAEVAADGGAPQAVTLPVYVSSAEDLVGVELSLEFEPADRVKPAGALELVPPAGMSADAFYLYSDYNAEEGWLVAGLVHADAASVSSLPAEDVSGLHLFNLQLQVEGAGSFEGVVRFANGVVHGGSLAVEKYNLFTTFADGSVVPEETLPHTKPGLIVADGTLSEADRLGAEGGELFSEVVFSFPGVIEETTTASIYVTDAGVQEDVDAISTQRAGMLSDIFSGVNDNETDDLLRVAASLLAEPGVQSLDWIEGFGVSTASVSFTHIEDGENADAYSEAVVYGPAGICSGESFSWLESELFEGSDWDAAFPKLWDLPAALLSTIEWPEGGASRSVSWMDITVDVNPQFAPDLIEPPVLNSPAPGAMVSRANARFEWQAVDGADCYILELKTRDEEDDFEPVWRILVVPGSTGDVVSVSLPALPAAADMTLYVPYTWQVTAIAAEDGAGSVTAEGADQLDITYRQSGASASEEQAVTFVD